MTVQATACDPPTLNKLLCSVRSLLSQIAVAFYGCSNQYPQILAFDDDFKIIGAIPLTSAQGFVIRGCRGLAYDTSTQKVSPTRVARESPHCRGACRARFYKQKGGELTLRRVGRRIPVSVTRVVIHHTLISRVHHLSLSLI
jgi:hypothetical protein